MANLSYPDHRGHTAHKKHTKDIFTKTYIVSMSALVWPKASDLQRHP